LKTRYKIVFLDIVLTFLFYLSFLVYYNYTKETDGEIADALTNVINSIIYLTHYAWINLFWLSIIGYGFVKKKKELLLGGLYSLILSFGLYLLIFTF